MIKANKCVVGTIYFLTGNWWCPVQQKYLTNTPVRLKNSHTEKWTETVQTSNSSFSPKFTKRYQKKYWIFESTEDPKLTITAASYDSLFLAPYVPTQNENPVDTTV